MRVMPAVLLGWALSITAVQAGSESAHSPVKFEPGSFAKQRETIVKEIRTGERYREIGDQRGEQVIALLDKMGSLLQSAPSLDRLTVDQRAELFNHQEQVNTILTQAADDSRMVCRREVVTGSHRQSTVCKTVAQRRQESETSKDALRKNQRIAVKGQG